MKKVLKNNENIFFILISFLEQFNLKQKENKFMETKKISIKQNKDIASVFGITAIVLIIISGIFTGTTKWTLSDFTIMGTILIVTGLLVVLARRKIGNITYRTAAIIGLIAILIIIWVELAVGIFGTPFAGS